MRRDSAAAMSAAASPAAPRCPVAVEGEPRQLEPEPLAPAGLLRALVAGSVAAQAQPIVSGRLQGDVGPFGDARHRETERALASPGFHRQAGEELVQLGGPDGGLDAE
jgi:hypothetical protein